jgi:hypothetical protein
MVSLKLLNLAFDSSANENEAINAFIKARRELNSSSIKPDFSKVFTAVKETQTQAKLDVDLKVPARSFDSLLRSLYNWYNVKPYFNIEYLESRKLIGHRHMIRLHVFLDTNSDVSQFRDFLTKLITGLNQ